MTSGRTPDLSLLLVATARSDAPFDLGRLRAALRGGVTVVEGRGKGLSSRELCDLYRGMMKVCHEHHVPFLVNDRPDIAVLLDAAGAHVGPEDLPPLAARRVLGERWLGVSARTEARLEDARKAGASYVGVGALRETGSKPEAPPIGFDGVRDLVRASSLPVVVIGGVMPEDAASLREMGAAGMAVASGILDASDPEAAARRYRDAWGASSHAPAS